MTITGLVDINEIEEEIAVYLRNSDILTTTIRGVTTTNDSGSWSGTTSHLINKPNIKNIRSITVDGNPLTFGDDYFVNYDYDDSGTIKCKITLNTSQTGDYVISYDYGSDKIFTDWPRNDITINSYPRIIIQILSNPIIDDSIDGLQKRNDFNITISVLDDDKRSVYNYLKTIKEYLLENRIGFYYIPYIKPSSLGPMLPQPDRHHKIVLCSMEFKGLFKQEVIS